MKSIFFILGTLFIVSCTTSISSLSQAADLFNTANKLRDDFDLEGAVETYKQALKIQPRMYAALYNMSLVQAEMGSYGESLDGLRKLSKIEPSNLRIQRAMAWVYQQSGDFQQAYKYYTAILEVLEGDKKALAGLAKTTESMGYFDNSIRIWEQLIAMDVKDEYLIGLANVLALNGDYQLSISRYSEVLVNDRNNIEARKGAAESARKDADYYRALDYLIDGIEAGDESINNAELWWHISSVYILDLRDYEQGLKFFEMALDAGYYNEEEIYLPFIEKIEGGELRKALTEIVDSIKKAKIKEEKKKKEEAYEDERSKDNPLKMFSGL